MPRICRNLQFIITTSFSNTSYGDFVRIEDSYDSKNGDIKSSGGVRDLFPEIPASLTLFQFGLRCKVGDGIWFTTELIIMALYTRVVCCHKVGRGTITTVLSPVRPAVFNFPKLSHVNFYCLAMNSIYVTYIK
ncbi:uncharacterized protein [Spinacia oleracea]|uniref:Uncharacterized protein n=1 Tax=Spinacia oleracea TaxID=3562 RepID=A0ABM3QWD2_SPIOL|nr:uncharacterized protein LOC130462785 [Spinacia oleracea]XP_056687676.1 uncharacterized protein LOC130462785 [Spinacia oleracea]